MSQLGFFGESEALPVIAPEVCIKAALTRGDLAFVMATLAPLCLSDMQALCLKAGFSLGYSKTKAAFLRDLEPQILRACREQKTGFELRTAPPLTIPGTKV